MSRDLGGHFENMMTSSNGNIFRVTGLLCGEVTGHPAQRPVTRSFDIFFDMQLNQQLSKQWRRRWFETASCSLWRNCNEVCSAKMLSKEFIAIRTLNHPVWFCSHHKIYGRQKQYGSTLIPGWISIYIYHKMWDEITYPFPNCNGGAVDNILQVHCWGCLVVQVMFHALMTSLMTSQDHKVGQILKLIYLRQYLS